MKTFRTKVFMGRQNIPSSNGSAEAFLARQFQENMQEIMDNFQEFVDYLDGVSADILVEALEPTLGKALEYCPEDTGDLRASGYLEAEKFRGGARAELGFGKGGNPSYAIYVHEMPYNHEEPTRSKFLQAALDEDYFSIINSLPGIIRAYSGT